MYRRLLVMMVAACAAVGVATPALAQSGRVQSSGGGRLEIGGSVGFAGAYALASERVTLQTGGGGETTFFEVDTTVTSAPLVDARIGWWLTPSLAVEGVFGIARRNIETEVRLDVDNAPPTTARSRLTQYTAEAGVTWDIRRLQWRQSRIRTYVTGGGGYLRELHEERTAVDTGAVFFGGAGIRYGLGGGRASGATGRVAASRFGLRGEVRFVGRTGGFDTDDEVRFFPRVHAGAYVRF